MRTTHLISTLFTALILASSAAHAQVNYGDFLGSGVDFLQVTETTQTAGDPAILWDTPALNGFGTGLQFFPPAFLAECAAGSSDQTLSLLTTTIMAQGANTIETLALQEFGDVTITKFPPPGDPTTNATASASGFLTVIEDTSGPIPPVAIPFTASFSVGGAEGYVAPPFSLPGDFGTSLWNGAIFIDVAAQVPNATKAVLTLDNDLVANCGAGNTSGKIQKKVVEGPGVAIMVNPLPCELEIEKTCCIPSPPSPGVDICEGKVERLVLDVVGGGCDATTNDQEGKAKCSGFDPLLDDDVEANSGSVTVTVLKDEDKVKVNGQFTPLVVDLAAVDTLEFTHIDGELKASTKFEISSIPDGISQELTIHTSCSKALGCLDQFGTVQVVEVQTTEGGTTVCSEPDPNGTQCTPPMGQLGVECEERPVQIVFEYTGADCQDPLPQPSDKAECSGDPGGANDVSITYTGKDPGKFSIDPASLIDVGDTFTFTATGRDELHSESTFLIAGATILQNVTFHTSCSQPLACGDEFGALKIVEFTDKDGTVVSCDTDPGPLFQDACEVDLAPPSPHCTSKVMELQLAYIADEFGYGCSVTNSQDGKASCTGTTDDLGTDVGITILTDPSKISADPDSGLVPPTITSASIFSITKDDNGTPKELPSTVEFTATGTGGTQTIEIHTSCSKPLNLGDVFGNFAVVGLDRKDDGFVGIADQVEYQYTVTNPNTNVGPATNVSVVDDPHGKIVSGETLALGESKTFYDTRTLYATLTNKASVTGEVEGAMCTPAMDELTVTVNLPPQGSFDCSDAKPIDSLSMIWAGTQDVCVVACDGDAGCGTPLLTQDNVMTDDVVTVSGMGGSPNDQQWEIFAAGNCGGTSLGISQFHISCSDDNMNGIEDCGKPQGNGKSDDGDLLDLWLLEGMDGDQTLNCTPDPIQTSSRRCGLGFELALLLPGLLWLRGRRRRLGA